MARRNPVKVRVENQLIRFTAPETIRGEEVVEKLGGKASGKYVILALKNPRATLLVDDEGRLVVHGTSHPEVAWAAAREMMLRLGRSDEGLTTESGPLVVSFDYGQPLRVDRVPEFFPGFTHDSRLDCIRIEDELHDLDIFIFSNGRGIALQARHRNLVEMAASHWGTKFDSEGLFIDILVQKNGGETEDSAEEVAEEPPLEIVENED